MEEPFGLTQILHAIRRWKWAGLAIAVLGIIGATTLALIWPATYSSTATLLIEEPDVPSDLVKSTVSNFADDRLQVIQQRVMSSKNLNQIITDLNLYEGMREGSSIGEVIDYMRTKIDMEVLSANFSNQPGRTTTQNTASIVFSLTFQARSPKTAQQVTDRLAKLYLAENETTRNAKAAGTTQFLSEESKKLEAGVQAYQQKLEDFKSKNNGSLPEQTPLSMQILDRAQSQMLDSRRDMQSLLERRAGLQAQLAQLSPYLPMTSQGQPATPQAQLLALELSYVDLSAKYGPGHPEIVRLQKQIQTLKTQLGTTDDPVSVQSRYSTLESQLAAALQRYGENHPEVQKLRRQLADLKGQMNGSSAPMKSLLTAPKGPPDNPMFIQLQSQLGEVDSQIQGARTEAAGLQAKIDDLDNKLLQASAVEGEYNSLKQQYDAAVQRYLDFKNRQSDAEVAQNMELQSKGETFTITDAPVIPDLPDKPNRRLLLLVGTMFSILMALGAMVGLDMLDPRIYESRNLHHVFGEPPLTAIPYFATATENWTRKLRASMVVAASVVVIGVALTYVNAAIMPLDTVYPAFVSRLDR
ncbi:MAG: hypothetical protein ABWY00_14305 [Dongiaceae bacterium]